MQFKADTDKIRRWREERHWSQEHLAELADIGVRTVQRIETGGMASRETLTALAAAFNVDVMALTVDPEVEAKAILKQERDKVTAGLRLSFWIHLASYVFGMILFAGISLGIQSGTYTMLWPTIWWTVGMAGHALTVVIVELATRYKLEFQSGNGSASSR